MAIRRIDNVTYHLETSNTPFTLPTQLPAIMDDGSIVYANIDSWLPSSTVNISIEGDYIHVGTVLGYPSKILASVIVGGHDENPISIFPNEIDNFGNPKVDIQTADIPDIDDYQYFKAKYPRSLTEGLQLERLRDLLVDKVILASDINHLRNAVIEIEKFLRALSDRVDELENRIDLLELRVEKLEEETIIDGHNMGRGGEIFSHVDDRIMSFRTIVGEGDVEVTTTRNEVVIEVPEKIGCGIPVFGESYKVCGSGVKYSAKLSDGKLDITENGSFGFRMIPLVSTPSGNFNSMIWTLGVGSTEGAEGAARMLKCNDGFIFEVKSSSGETYSGFEVRASNIGTYEDVQWSKVNEEVKNGMSSSNPNGLNVYDLRDVNILESILW